MVATKTMRYRTALCPYLRRRVPVVEIGSALKTAREGVDSELRSFVLVVKYNDLNLWSVKQSTQKAHVQLHKILRRFKRDCAVSASSILQERLLPVPPLPSSEDTGNENMRPPVGGETLTKIIGVLTKMDRSLSKLLDAQPLIALRCAEEELLAVLDSQVRYEGEDEEKGKQQGQALFNRQKPFFNLVRTAKKVGFNTRRGLQVDSEELTLETLTAMGSCGEDAGDLVRWAGIARNIFLKRFASIKSPQQAQYQEFLRRLNAFWWRMENADATSADGPTLVDFVYNPAVPDSKNNSKSPPRGTTGRRGEQERRRHRYQEGRSRCWCWRRLICCSLVVDGFATRNKSRLVQRQTNYLHPFVFSRTAQWL